MKGGEWVVLGALLIGLALWLTSSNKRAAATLAPTPIQTISNAETWEWVDWQGNPRKVTVNREVHSTHG